MKRSVPQIGFKKHLLLIAIAVLTFFSVSAQLDRAGFHANFGVDADTRAGATKYGTVPSPNVGDDWFSLVGIGRGVIDTSNAAYYKSQLQNNKNISFTRYMSEPAFSAVGNKLWLDAVYLRDYTDANGARDSTIFGYNSGSASNPASWDGRTGSLDNYADIVDAYAHFRRDGLNIKDSLWFYTGISTAGTNDERTFNIELFKKRVSYDIRNERFTTEGLNGGRTEWLFDIFGNIIQTGDVNISVSYEQGREPVIEVHLWVSRITYQTTRPRLFNFGDNYEGGWLYGYASVESKANTTNFGSGQGNYGHGYSTDTTYSTPWGTVNTSGVWSRRYNQAQFVELGLNLTRIGIDPSLYSTLNACDRLFQSIFFKTRSAHSCSEDMVDFAGPVQLTTPTLNYNTIDNADTLTCTNPIRAIAVNNPTNVGVFSWSTLDGNIAGSNHDGSAIEVDKEGQYILTARLAAGCAATRVEFIQVLEDKTPPVATADITMTPSGELQLLGGDPILSNIPTRFGCSKGLEWDWKGPNAFASTEQNPILNTEWLWGAYYLTLKELRNGCVARATLDMSFEANQNGVAIEETIGAGKMSLRKIGTGLYLTASQKESSQAVVAFYSTNGQLLGQQNIDLNQGNSTIALKLAATNQVRVVAVYKGKQLVFTRKINH